MQPGDQEYHVRRARQELDLGYRANGRSAAASHLRLAALHMASAQTGIDGPHLEGAFDDKEALNSSISDATDGQIAPQVRTAG